MAQGGINFQFLPNALVIIKVYVVVQLLSCIRLFETPWTAAHQASLSFSISWSSFKIGHVH